MSLREQCDFALEATLSARGLAQRLTRLQAEGYTIHLLYLWLRDPDSQLEEFVSGYGPAGIRSPRK